MTENFVLYTVVAVIGFLAVFSLVIGLEKMVKVILGNYILSSICLAASQSINLLIDFFLKSPELKIASITYQSLADFFVDSKVIIILILYVVLLIIVFKNSSIRINLPDDKGAQNILYIFLVPLTILSMILAIQIATMGINLIDSVEINALASQLGEKNYLYTFLKLNPLWIFLHGLATILITFEMRIGLKTGI